jgi:AcrR family transcriptional regulator
VVKRTTPSPTRRGSPTGRPTPGTRSSSRSRAVVSNAERRATTRRAVLDAAAKCFDRSGYLSTTLDDVTSTAGLTKGAVYFHFGSKEALAAVIIEEQAQYWPLLIEEIASRPGSPLDHLVAVSYEVNRALRDDVTARAGFRLSLDQDLSIANPAEALGAWTERAASLLRKARKAGALADGVSPTMAAGVIVAGVLGSHHLAAVVDGQTDARKRLDAFWALMLPQLAP